MIEPLERVRDALREHDCRPGDGDRFNCRCPAHDDRSPSLSVAVGADGRVLMTCQAGCAFEDVVAKLGLETSDLFVARNGDSADRRIAATYDYVDEQGALLYQVVRYEPKDFRQRRPGTNGEEWVWNLRGVRRVLYRLPKVVEAIKAKQTVWLTEGERDVHSLEDRGVTATTWQWARERASGAASTPRRSVARTWSSSATTTSWARSTCGSSPRS